MKFGEALEEMKLGRKVQRTGWGNRYMWIGITLAKTDQVTGAELAPAVTYLKSSDGDTCVTPWSANATDLLSDDWENVIEVLPGYVDVKDGFVWVAGKKTSAAIEARKEGDKGSPFVTDEDRGRYHRAHVGTDQYADGTKYTDSTKNADGTYQPGVNQYQPGVNQPGVNQPGVNRSGVDVHQPNVNNQAPGINPSVNQPFVNSSGKPFVADPAVFDGNAKVTDKGADKMYDGKPDHTLTKTDSTPTKFDAPKSSPKADKK